MKHRLVKQFEEDFKDEHGYIYCELCNINQSFAFSTHHIVFKSEYGKHPEINNKNNLILVCADCHKKLHDKKELNNQLKKERDLYEMFNSTKSNISK